MKKAAAILLALALFLTSCGSAAPSSQGEIKADEKLMEEFWEEYFDDCPFTISSGLNDWDEAEDLEPIALVNFLFLKMQRNDDFEDTNIDAVNAGTEQVIRISADKLNEYCERYFLNAADVRNINSVGCCYDKDTDTIVIDSAYRLSDLPEVSYDSFNELPFFSLEELTLNEDEAKAKIAIPDFRYPTQSEEHKLFITMSLLKKGEGYKFASSKLDIPPMKGADIKGESKSLPAFNSFDSYTTTGPIGDEVPLFSYSDSGLQVSHMNLQDGSFEDDFLIPIDEDHGESSVILRSGRMFIIETFYSPLPDGSLDIKNPSVKLKEISLKGDIKEIAIPQNTVHISDVTGDLSKMLYKESLNGDFLIYDFNTKTSAPILNTHPETEGVKSQEDLYNIESFGHGRFSMDGKYVILYKFGYEWGAGYASYNMETGEMIEFPIITAWGGYPIMTPTGLYIGGIADEGSADFSHGFLPFGSDEVASLPTAPFPENFRYNYVPNGEDRFIPMLMPADEEKYYDVPDTGLAEMALVCFDAESMTMADTGARMMRAPFSNCVIFTLNDGSFYFFDSNISSEKAYIIDNPFLK